MHERTMIEVELTFRPVFQGGRQILDGILSGYTYRPHIVIGSADQQHAVVADGNRGTEDYLGVAFTAGPIHIESGQPCVAQACLVYTPEVDYSAVTPGATFTLREGGRIVGHGRVTKRWTELQ